MVPSGAGSPARPATGLTRALCLLILALMAAAAAYGSVMALRNYNHISV